MAWFAVYRVSDGALVSVGTVVADPLPAGIASKNVGLARPEGLWNPATLNFDAPIPRKGTLTRRDFWKRFTEAERESLHNVRLTGTQLRKNKIEAFLYYIADGVDLDDVYVIATVQGMENFGILAAGRAAVILA
jgi:hypothetical protein